MSDSCLWTSLRSPGNKKAIPLSHNVSHFPLVKHAYEKQPAVVGYMDKNPVQFLRMLRDHLARHDRPVIFLFGAGTSCAVNVAPLDANGKPTGFKSLIPAVIPLTKICLEAATALGGGFPAAWKLLEAECPPSVDGVNIETILSRVRMKIQAIGGADTSCGLSVKALKQLEDCITKAILKEVNVSDADIPENLPHDKFARWAGGHARSKALEVFTPNYDMLIEIALEKALVPVFDGFAGTHKPFFLPELVEREAMMPSREWVRVWKIHGSVNWELSTTPGGNRICRTSSRSATHLILPSHLKYDESRKQPYLAMLGRLSKLVDQEDALLIILGYSFSDDHINAAIVDSLERRRRAHAFLFSYNDLDANSRAVVIACKLPNLTVAGPNAAVMGGRFEHWSDKIDPDDAHAASVGESIELPDPATGKSTRMLLGDFNRFCSFLEAMTE